MMRLIANKRKTFLASDTEPENELERTPWRAKAEYALESIVVGFIRLRRLSAISAGKSFRCRLSILRAKRQKSDTTVFREYPNGHELFLQVESFFVALPEHRTVEQPAKLY